MALATTITTRLARRRHGLSLIEMLIALTISATLLTAALAALNAMFKGYKQTTESASTHVVSRIVMSRIQGMLRTGEDFGPIPAQILDSAMNPIASDYFEFVGQKDAGGEPLEIVRIEYRYPGENEGRLLTWSATNGTRPIDPNDPPAPGPGELWFMLFDATTTPPTLVQEHPLLTGVRVVTFTLAYDIGPQLVRGTVDMTIEPNDSVDLTVGVEGEMQTFRLVASAAPRTGVD